LGVTNAFDPQANVGGGSHYLRELLERYNFDLIKALAAYNAGPQRVEQYRGIPPYYETRTYVARVVHDYNRKKIAQERAAAEAEKSARTAAEKKTTASSTGRKIASPKPVHTASGSAKSAAPIASSSVASNSSH
jgi:membrane-bound lytic murein transglycosylase MltF